ncbi:MAG: hypothetical protein AB1714_00645 [Acidobacteriota bacterium]
MIVDSRDDGGGHVSYDFTIEAPEETIEDSSLYKQGLDIGKDIRSEVPEE